MYMQEDSARSSFLQDSNNQRARQGRFQDFFQGVAEISSGGGENLPGGGEKIARYTLSLSVFCFSTQHYLFTPNFFDILDTCFKEIHKIKVIE